VVVEKLSPRESDLLFDRDCWPKFPLEEVLREKTVNGLSPRPSDSPPGTPILRISAATSRTDAVIDEKDFKYLPVGKTEANKYKLERGDLLACRFNGNLHYVGRFALYQGYLNKSHLYPDKLIRIRVNQDMVMPEFVCFAMNSSKGRKIIESFCATTAGNIGISAGNLRTVPVPVPSLSEQRRIVAYLNDLQAKIESLKRLQSETADELDALLPSVLDKAFRGEL
jgi:type I restriction enzyme S subunit